MRGISPAIAFVLILAIALLSTLAIYYWVVGQATSPAMTESSTDIQVHNYNSTLLKITNIGVVNTTSLSAMSTSAGDCTFSGPTVLMPGVTYPCSLAAPASGEIRVWAIGVNSATIYL
ncbi:MAG: hypothetical protein KAW41_00570 [Candidatus Diapherotrites archaeon]|nr:hypothetical protein [Candidatus Diapherotrites archaeon]